MADGGQESATFNTLHEALRGGFADLQAAVIAEFRSLPSRETSEEMVRRLPERDQDLLDWLTRDPGEGSRLPGCSPSIG